MIFCVDYDGVADDPRVQRFIKKAILELNEVFIVTARRQNEFSENEMKFFLKNTGMQKEMIIFCDEKPKMEILFGINADIYIDNIDDEFQNILNSTDVLPMLLKL